MANDSPLNLYNGLLREAEENVAQFKEDFHTLKNQYNDLHQKFIEMQRQSRSHRDQDDQIHCEKDHEIDTLRHELAVSRESTKNLEEKLSVLQDQSLGNSSLSSKDQEGSGPFCIDALIEKDNECKKWRAAYHKLLGEIDEKVEQRCNSIKTEANSRIEELLNRVHALESEKAVLCSKLSNGSTSKELEATYSLLRVKELSHGLIEEEKRKREEVEANLKHELGKLLTQLGRSRREKRVLETMIKSTTAHINPSCSCRISEQRLNEELDSVSLENDRLKQKLSSREEASLLNSKTMKLELALQNSSAREARWRRALCDIKHEYSTAKNYWMTILIKQNQLCNRWRLEATTLANELNNCE